MVIPPAVPVTPTARPATPRNRAVITAWDTPGFSHGSPAAFRAAAGEGVRSNDPPMAPPGARMARDRLAVRTRVSGAASGRGQCPGDGGGEPGDVHRTGRTGHYGRTGPGRTGWLGAYSTGGPP